MPDTDIIVIGSGPAGAHAAKLLVEAGKTVLMIDGGNDAPDLMKHAPDISYEKMRRTRDDQWKWFLGEEFSGVPLKGMEGGLGGGQISGNRRYVVEGTDRFLPLVTGRAQVVQSLAKGGLGAAWGAACAYMTEEELELMGLPAKEMDEQYDAITQDIGISGPQNRKHVQPPLTLDAHGTFLMQKAQSLKGKVSVVQPHSAVLTQDRGERKANKYHDMDYWCDPERSVYRPQYTVEELEKEKNFTYLPHRLVETVRSKDGEVSVVSRPMGGQGHETHTAKKAVVAAGTVGSARILARSLHLTKPLPFIGKAHAFLALMRPSALGRKGEEHTFSLCQLLVCDEEKTNGLHAGIGQLYSYKSLQLFRLLTSLPLPAPQALQMLAMLTPSLLIADVRFPAMANPHNTLRYNKHNHVISIHVETSQKERDARRESLGRIRRALRGAGIYAVRSMELPEASTSHFAGTIPIGDGMPLSVDINGKLKQMDNVYIADASVFRCLPAKPHTLTIMANARRTAARMLAT